MRKLILASSILLLLSTSFASNSTEPANWKLFISKIEAGNHQELTQLQTTINKIGGSLNEEKSIELVEALGFSLIDAPLTTLAATDEISKNKDTFIQRFDTESVCTLPLIMSYTKESTLRYYHLASTSLIQAGKPAEKCLSIMKSSMDEVRASDRQGNMVWGKKVF